MQLYWAHYYACTNVTFCECVGFLSLRSSLRFTKLCAHIQLFHHTSTLASRLACVSTGAVANAVFVFENTHVNHSPSAFSIASTQFREKCQRQRILWFSTKLISGLFCAISTSVLWNLISEIYSNQNYHALHTAIKLNSFFFNTAKNCEYFCHLHQVLRLRLYMRQTVSIKKRRNLKKTAKKKTNFI